MIEKILKFVVMELSDDMRTVLAQLCEDWRLDPSSAINPLCNTAICYDLDSLDLCEEYQGVSGIQALVRGKSQLQARVQAATRNGALSA